jgi:hypothetical protein
LQLELVVKAGQLDYVTPLVEELHWNRSATGSIPARKHIWLHFSQLLLAAVGVINLSNLHTQNFHLKIPSAFSSIK